METFAIRGFDRRAAAPARRAVAAEPELGISGFLLAGLDGLAHGVALMDENSRLIYANASARATLSRAGWSLKQGVARSAQAPEHAAWTEALRQLFQRGRRQLFELGGSTEDHSFAALVPVVLEDQQRAFVTFGRRDLCGVLELQLFGSRYGLTYAENRVLGQLSLGRKPAEIAQAHGVALSTVLTQVAAIRSKTLSASISELLSTLSRMPPLSPALMGIGGVGGVRGVSAPLG